MSLRLDVILHGTGAAFFRKPGCPCVRCVPPEPTATPAEHWNWGHQAHTAASLVIARDDVTIDHTLIDCGQGVVNNLVGLATPAQAAPIQRVLLTHGHFDHIAGLDGLLHGIKLGVMAGDLPSTIQPWPMPIYATRQTWERKIGMNPARPVESGIYRYMLDTMRHVDITTAARDQQPIRLHPALEVQPIPVEHYLDSVHYCFTFWPAGEVGNGTPVRIGICWDLQAYPCGRARDVWRDVMLDPRTGWLAEQMRGLDLLVIESTTWGSRSPGHIGFAGPALAVAEEPTAYSVRDLLLAWKPKQTKIVHYDGWDDRRQATGEWWREDLGQNRDPAHGPVRDVDLLRAMRARLGNQTTIDIGQPGMIISFG